MKGGKRKKKEHSKSSDSTTIVSNLPSSLIEQILIKLPIKSIVRFRCVSKTWKNLISEKYFSTLYLNNPPFNILFKCKKNLNKIDVPCLYFVEIGLNGNILPTQINLPINYLPKTRGTLEMKCSCNGLLCLVHKPLHEDIIKIDRQNRDTLYNNEVVYIMNPTIGEIFILPKFIWAESRRPLFYAFGFCTQSNLYKVFRIVKYGNHDMLYFEIFTIGVDHKWRSFAWNFYFEDSSFASRLLSSSSRGITHDGVVYFACERSNRYSIFAFDLEKEKGFPIILPSQVETDNMMLWRYYELSLCDGNICLCDNSHGKIVVIWKLERGGIADELWSRDILNMPCYNLSFPKFLPITKLRDGDLLISSEHHHESQGLISYNEKTKEFRKLTDDEERNDIFFHYTPNFLPMSIDPLQKYCESLDSSNALDILEISDIVSNQSLKETTLNFIVRNMDDIVFSARYKAFVRDNHLLAVEVTQAMVKDTYKKKRQFSHTFK